MKRYVYMAVAAFCVGIGIFFVFHDQVVETPVDTGSGGYAQGVSSPKAAKFRAHLYFSDPEQRYLTAEERLLVSPSDSVVERARAMIGALIDGPRSPLARTLPKETGLRAVHVTGDGAAYVDFDGSIVDRHPKGTMAELLSVFSVVNTLALNMPEIQAVQILIEGREAKTLAGHVEMRFPFQPNLLMMQ